MYSYLNVKFLKWFSCFDVQLPSLLGLVYKHFLLGKFFIFWKGRMMLNLVNKVDMER